MAKKKAAATVAVSAAPAYDMALLKSIVAATQAGPESFLYTSVDAHTPMITAVPPLVLVNRSAPDAQGNLPTRATDAGISVVAAQPVAGTPAPAAPSAAAPSPQPSDFVIEDGIPVPPIKRGAIAGTTIYPFDRMEIGQSFFVPATTDRPNVAKSLASTISSANNRYFKASTDAAGNTMKDATGAIIGTQERKFVVRSVDEPGKGKGARIHRVAP